MERRVSVAAEGLGIGRFTVTLSTKLVARQETVTDSLEIAARCLLRRRPRKPLVTLTALLSGHSALWSDRLFSTPSCR